MKNFNSHLEIELTRDDHLILYADNKVYSALRSGVYHSFEEYVDPLYRDNFHERVTAADGKWFPARIASDTASILYYVKATLNEKDNTIHLTLINIDELMSNNDELIEIITTFRSQLMLYDDVFFDYDPEAKTLSLANTQAADYDAGIYTIDEAEAMLCQRVTPNEQENVKGFISQVKSKSGRFSTRIEGNLVNSDPTITTTLLEASYVFYHNGKERVVGHIHPESSKRSVKVSSLKRDSLTGLVDKADITRIAQDRIDDKCLEGTTLVILDLDFFKSINDTYGHQFGDVVLKRVSDIISAEVGNNGIAGRFGGDEFLLVFYNIPEEGVLRNHLKAIKNTVKSAFADKGIDDCTPLSVSIGTATFPNDADNYDDVFMLADHCLYIAKEKGRNRYIIYDKAKHGSLEDIKQKNMTKKKMNERGDLSYGDIIIKMYDVVLHGSGTTPELLMDEFAETFELQRVMLLVSEPYRLRYSTGSDKVIGKPMPDMLLGVLNSPIKEKYLAGRDFVVVNKVDNLPPQAATAKEILRNNGVFSYILMRFYDKDDTECIMIISSIGKYTQWNEMHFMYYKAFADILSRFSLGTQHE